MAIFTTKTSLLVACLALASVATCCEAKEKKSQEQLDFEAAQKAYKELFVWSSSLSTPKVLEKLEAMRKMYGRDDLDMPLDYNLLISFNQTSEAKCDSYEYVKRLKDTYEEVERNYRALRKYMRDCLDRQLDLCNFEQRFRERFEAFKVESPDTWRMIQEFNRQADKFGKRDPDWQSEAFDNELQMNEALERMARQTAVRGQDPARNAYNLATSLRSGCSQFDDRLAASLLMASIADRKGKNKELKEWGRLMRVCRSVGRVSFERSLGDIFGHTYYPEAQKAWEWYENFREGWAR